MSGAQGRHTEPLCPPIHRGHGSCQHEWAWWAPVSSKLPSQLLDILVGTLSALLVVVSLEIPKAGWLLTGVANAGPGSVKSMRFGCILLPLGDWVAREPGATCFLRDFLGLLPSEFQEVLGSGIVGLERWVEIAFFLPATSEGKEVETWAEAILPLPGLF